MQLRRCFDTVALWIGRVYLAALLFVLSVQAVLRVVRRFRHFPAPPFIAAGLASRWRRAAQPPEEQMDRVGVRPGMTVLELGPGPGFFTVEAARRTAPGGRVIAVDIEPRMIEMMAERVARAGVTNVEPHVADAYHLPLPNDSVDLAFLVGVLAEIPDRARALAELKRVLKPGGVLSVSEMIVDPDYPRRSTEIRWCTDAGFRLVESKGNVVWYTLNFRKPE